MAAVLTPSSRKSSSAETSCEPSLFPSNTPLGYVSTDTNLYRYVGNSPTNATDPSGLQEVLEIRTIDVTNYDDFSKFLEALKDAKSGDLVTYYGHCQGGQSKKLKFGTSTWYSEWFWPWTPGDYVAREKAAETIESRTEKLVLLLGACGTEEMGNYFNGLKLKDGQGAISAVISTNIKVTANACQQLVSLFKKALVGDKMTIQGAVDYANQHVKLSTLDYDTTTGVKPEMKCVGPDINMTLEQIRKRKK